MDILMLYEWRRAWPSFLPSCLVAYCGITCQSYKALLMIDRCTLKYCVKTEALRSLPERNQYTDVTKILKVTNLMTAIFR